MPKTIRQTATFNASPRGVCDALITSRGYSEITGGGAKISGKVGGKFSAFDGYCSGVKIVQSWRATDWPVGHSSISTGSR